MGVPRPDVSIVTTGHDVADARLHRHVEALAASGLAVEVLGLGEQSEAPPAAIRVQTSNRGAMVSRYWGGLTIAWRARGRVLVSLDPDSAVACHRRVRFSRSILHVADVHEDYVALLRDRAWARGPAAWAGLRVARAGERAAAAANLTSVADNHLLPDAPRRLVVRNVPVVADREPRASQPRAVYVGDIRASRGAFDMLDAIRDAPGWTLDLIGPVAAADRVEFDRHAAELADRVTWHGRLPPAAAWAIARGSWAGFSLLHDTPAFRDASPSKVYEYAANGIAAIVTGLPRQRELIEASGGGVVAADAEEASAQLREWSARPALLAALADAGRSWALSDPAFDEGSPRLARAVAALLRS